MSVPSIIAIIVNYRTADLVIGNLEALSAQRCDDFRLTAIVVDGGSGDNSAARIADAIDAPPFRNWVSLLPLQINGGFGYANNQAILTAVANGLAPDFFWLINPDATPAEGALAALVEGMHTYPKAGAFGSQLYNEDGTPSGSAFRFPTVAREFARGLRLGRVSRSLGIAPILLNEFEAAEPVDWVTGASVLLRSKALKQCHLFDGGFFLYFEEVELMARMRLAQWEIRSARSSRVVHIEGASTGVKYVRDGVEPAPPEYWFSSQRRFFALVLGKSAVFRARLAWLTGNLLWRGIARVTQRGCASVADAERKALLRHGLQAQASDVRPCTVKWGDAPGGEPGWMTRP